MMAIIQVVNATSQIDTVIQQNSAYSAYNIYCTCIMTLRKSNEKNSIIYLIGKSEYENGSYPLFQHEQATPKSKSFTSSFYARFQRSSVWYKILLSAIESGWIRKFIGLNADQQ